MWVCIQVSKVVNGQLLQLVSGSIYISTATVSLVSGDGILIESDEKGEVYKVNLYVSFIADDGIEITEGYEPQEENTTTDSGNNSTTEGEQNKPKPHPMKVVKIKAITTPTSFIGIDGITVTESIENIPHPNQDGTVDKWTRTKVVVVEHDIKSYIGKDGIKVSIEDITTENKDPNTGEVTTKVCKALIIQGEEPSKFSFIGKDGITIAQA